jgi:transglutaminase/protease-like cytokinesis protein 3
MLNSFSKKLFLFISVALITASTLAQESYALLSPEYNSEKEFIAEIDKTANENSIEEVDHHARSLKKKFHNIPDLANALTSRYSSDEIKVRSIFIWITENIAYDCAAYHSNNEHKIHMSYRTSAELEKKRKEYYYRYAEKVLRSKKGICEGYAVLFQELCKASGINSEIIVGKANTNKKNIRNINLNKNFATDHAWNKVKLGNTWYQLDATWASGYCDKAVKKFYKEFNPEYYLSPMDRTFPTHAINHIQTLKRNNLSQP